MAPSIDYMPSSAIKMSSFFLPLIRFLVILSTT